MTHLVVEHLHVRYQQHVVLRDINLDASGGQLIGLIGPNGAGKSTLLRAIAGTLTPNAGRVLLDQTDLGAMDANRRARQVAVVPQSPHVPVAFKVAEVVLMGRHPHLPRFGGEQRHDYEVAQQAMQRTDTWGLADRRLGTLSGGELQRVLIARALAQEPRLLLMDEPTAHLDPKHQIATLNLARQLADSGLLVIIAIHDLTLAGQYADRLALLTGELLTYDAPERVLTTEWIRRAYDVAALISPHPHTGTPVVTLLADDPATVV
jgi:iron complex transport system ATP-binding protein